MTIMHCPHCRQPVLPLDILPVDLIAALLQAHHGEDGWSGWYQSATAEDVAGLGPVTLVDSDGGFSGGGEHVSRIFRIAGRHFRKTGYYASYDGTTWDGPFTEVKPVDKTVTFYE